MERLALLALLLALALAYAQPLARIEVKLAKTPALVALIEERRGEELTVKDVSRSTAVLVARPGSYVLAVFYEDSAFVRLVELKPGESLEVVASPELPLQAVEMEMSELAVWAAGTYKLVSREGLIRVPAGARGVVRISLPAILVSEKGVKIISLKLRGESHQPPPMAPSAAKFGEKGLAEVYAAPRETVNVMRVVITVAVSLALATLAFATTKALLRRGSGAEEGEQGEA